jgi:hypothetical protein
MVMTKSTRFLIGAVLVLLFPLELPLAQTAPDPNSDVDEQPPAAAPRGSARKPAAPARPTSINGAWTGQVSQVGSQSEYSVVLTINDRGAQTDYPELNCSGRLARVGASKGYTFYAETITKGHAEKGGRCVDGTVTVSRAGDALAYSWFGVVESTPVIAHSTLSKR